MGSASGLCILDSVLRAFLMGTNARRIESAAIAGFCAAESALHLMKTANETTSTTTLKAVETSRKMREHRRPQLTPDCSWENLPQIERAAFPFYSAKGGGKHFDQIPASRLATRLERLRNTLRPTPQ